MKKFSLLLFSALLSVSLMTGCGGNNAQDAAVEKEPKQEDATQEVEEVEEEVAVEESEEYEVIDDYFAYMKEMYLANADFNDAAATLLELFADEEVMAALTDEDIQELDALYTEMLDGKIALLEELESVEADDPEVQELHEMLVALYELEVQSLVDFTDGIIEEDYEKVQAALAVMEEVFTLNEELAAEFQ